MNLERLVKPSVSKMKEYIVEKDTPNAIKLDANESPFSLFSAFEDKFFECLKNMQYNRYPDTDSTQLREKFSNYVGVKSENIMCTNGSDEAIHIISTTFLDKNDSILIHDPTFSMYGVFANLCGCNIISVGSSNPFEIDTNEIIENIKNYSPKLVYLCNPNNPTGTIISRENIIKIIESSSSIVIVDEAYYEFYGETVCDLIDKYDNLIVLRTMSKAFGLASIRVGFSIANKQMTKILYKVKSPYNLNSISQLAAYIMLENVDEVMKSVKIIKKNREALIEEFTQLGELTVYPTQSNFILIRTILVDKISQSLKNNGILIRNYSGNLKDCLRISVGTREENHKMISIIKEVLIK